MSFIPKLLLLVFILLSAILLSYAHKNFFPLHLCNWEMNYWSSICKEASHNSLKLIGRALKGNISDLPFHPGDMHINRSHHPRVDCSLEIFGKGYGEHALCKNIREIEILDHSKYMKNISDPSVKVVKGVDPRVYFLKNGIRHPIVGMESLTKMGYTTKDIVQLDETTLDSYPLGDAVGSQCLFYSFGIQNDLSFDNHVSKSRDCFGMLFDPSVSHQSNTGTKLLFSGFAANMLSRPDFGGAGTWVNGGHDPVVWQSISVPRLMKAFRHEYVDILKMDCEGCEFSVARDVAIDDPRFFKNVGQFTLEVHISRSWMKSSEYTHFLGLLFHMLIREGFYLSWFKIQGCGKEDEDAGCPPSLVKTGFPCDPGQMCQNYLFAKL